MGSVSNYFCQKVQLTHDACCVRVRRTEENDGPDEISRHVILDGRKIKVTSSCLGRRSWSTTLPSSNFGWKVTHLEVLSEPPNLTAERREIGCTPFEQPKRCVRLYVKFR